MLPWVVLESGRDLAIGARPGRHISGLDRRGPLTGQNERTSGPVTVLDRIWVEGAGPRETCLVDLVARGRILIFGCFGEGNAPLGQGGLGGVLARARRCRHRFVEEGLVALPALNVGALESRRVVHTDVKGARLDIVLFRVVLSRTRHRGGVGGKVKALLTLTEGVRRLLRPGRLEV